MLNRLAPLRVRLPLTVALLLAVCTGVVVTMSYRSVRHSVATATADRLRVAGERISSMLEPSFRRSQADAQKLGAQPDILEWLHGGDPSKARARLDSIFHSSAQNAAVVLTNAGGHSIVVGDSTQLAHAGVPRQGVGPFFVRRDSVAFSFAAPLVAGSDTLGTFVLIRKLAGSTSNTDAIGALLGPGSAMRIGNGDGSVWTDFISTKASPLSKDGLARLAAGDKQVVGDTVSAVVRVNGTPWILWVGEPTVDAIAPATALVRRLSLLAFTVVVFGAIVAWWIILRLTRPLDDLAAVSDAIARGERGRRMAHATVRDEAGRAAIAFNRMNDEIDAHHNELEDLVRERTSDLEKALDELRIAHEENKKKDRLATLGHLAGGVGHELRNPLGVMTNSLYVLEMMITQNDPMIRDYLGILKNQIALCEKIVADLLDFARTKAPARTAMRVEVLARQQVERLGPLNGVAIRWDIPSSLPMVEVDGMQIGQVVFNLITNAVQAMSEGGTLQLRAFHDGNGCAVLEVEDNGPGISDDVAKRIFEPLFTTKARGLGLGLSVSRLLAENNGGRLWFSSKAGMGTTFSLSLPVTHA